MAGPTAYSDAVARAKAKLAEQAARGQLGPLDPGGADAQTQGGGDYDGEGDDGTAHQDFSEVVAHATLGVDGEGFQPGAPPGQQETDPKVGGDVVTKTDDFKYFAKTEKVEHGVVFGWAIICKENGVDYYDLNRDPATGLRKGDHIPEHSMLDAACDFAKAERPGNEMHDGPEVGQYLFLFPMTTDIAKALGIITPKTGLLVGYKPPADVLAKFQDGTYTGFSIEGTRITDREVADAP